MSRDGDVPELPVDRAGREEVEERADTDEHRGDQEQSRDVVGDAEGGQELPAVLDPRDRDEIAGSARRTPPSQRSGSTPARSVSDTGQSLSAIQWEVRRILRWRPVARRRWAFGGLGGEGLPAVLAVVSDGGYPCATVGAVGELVGRVLAPAAVLVAGADEAPYDRGEGEHHPEREQGDPPEEVDDLERGHPQVGAGGP